MPRLVHGTGRYTILWCPPSGKNVAVRKCFTLEEARAYTRKRNEALGKPTETPFGVFMIEGPADCQLGFAHADDDLDDVPASRQRGHVMATKFADRRRGRAGV